MVAQILSFAARQRSSGPSDWTQGERAEFYRVTELLGRAGLPIVSETGISDENEPWIVFLREDTGDVIAHIARIDGEFIAASVTTDDVFKGRDFRQVLDQIVQRQPLVLPAARGGQRLYMHPTAILTAFLVTALLQTTQEARAEGTATSIWSPDPSTDIADHPSASHALNVLRAALLTKLEALRGNGQDSQSAQPVQFPLAAALAAVAFALLSSDQAGNADPSSFAILAAGSSEDASRHGDWSEQVLQRLLAKLEASDTPHLSAELSTDRVQLAAAIEQEELVSADPAQRLHDLIQDNRVALTDNSITAIQADTAFDAAAPASEEHPRLAETGHRDLASVVGVHTSDQGVVVAVASKAVGGGAQSATSEQSHDVSVATAGKIVPDQIYHFEISDSAARFFNLKGLVAQASDGLSHTFTFNFASHSGSFSRSDGSLAATTAVAAIDHPTVAVYEPSTDAALVIGSILSFAFSEKSELNISSAQQWLMTQLVNSNTHGVHGSRIVIIESASVNAPIFQFSQDLLMMTRSTAESYLGQISQSGQEVQLGLGDGGTVSLIGVVELA